MLKKISAQDFVEEATKVPPVSPDTAATVQATTPIPSATNGGPAEEPAPSVLPKQAP